MQLIVKVLRILPCRILVSWTYNYIKQSMARPQPMQTQLCLLNLYKNHLLWRQNHWLAQVHRRTCHVELVFASYKCITILFNITVNYLLMHNRKQTNLVCSPCQIRSADLWRHRGCRSFPGQEWQSETCHAMEEVVSLPPEKLSAILNSSFHGLCLLHKSSTSGALLSIPKASQFPGQFTKSKPPL